MQCNPAELGLAEQATRTLARTRRAAKNTACAAVLDAGGNTWLGLDLVSRMSSVCAEPAAIAAAQLDGAAELVAIAAVCYTPDLETITLISPCGACRERIWHHAPQARVLLPAPRPAQTHRPPPPAATTLPSGAKARAPGGSAGRRSGRLQSRQIPAERVRSSGGCSTMSYSEGRPIAWAHTSSPWDQCHHSLS